MIGYTRVNTDSGRDIRAKIKQSWFARTLRTLGNGHRIDTSVIDFSKAFDLVPHDRLLIKIAISGVDSRVVAWVWKFLLGRTQTVKVGRQLSEKVRVTSSVLKRRVLGPLVFLCYVNDSWRNIESIIRLFADDWVIYKN